MILARHREQGRHVDEPGDQALTLIGTAFGWPEGEFRGVSYPEGFPRRSIRILNPKVPDTLNSTKIPPYLLLIGT